MKSIFIPVFVLGLFCNAEARAVITQGREVGLDDPINRPPFHAGQPAEFSEIYNPHPRKRWATKEEIPIEQPFEKGFSQEWPELTFLLALALALAARVAPCLQ